jgi:hypothetical protein
MKTILCLLLICAMLFIFSPTIVLAAHHGGHHGGHPGFHGRGGFGPGPIIIVPPIYPYPYYPYPQDNRCWVPGHWEVSQNTGQQYWVPGHYENCY